MYKDHCVATIAPAMRQEPAIFRRGAMFAVCSIRQPTINVPDQLGVLFDGVEDENPLFGHKFKAFDFIMSNAAMAVHYNLCRFYKADWDTNEKAEQAIIALLACPGLGIVKAAFVAQLMGFDVACLDARNITRDQRNPRAFRTDGKRPEQLGAKVRAYVNETGGRAEEYWNAWCHDVAAAYGRTAQEISALHLAIVPANYIPF